MAVAEHRLKDGWRIANAFNQAVPNFLALEDFDFDAKEIDGHVDGLWMREADRVLLGGDDEFHVALDTALHEFFHFFARKAIVVGEAATDFDASAEAFQ